MYIYIYRERESVSSVYICVYVCYSRLDSRMHVCFCMCQVSVCICIYSRIHMLYIQTCICYTYKHAYAIHTVMHMRTSNRLKRPSTERFISGEVTQISSLGSLLKLLEKVIEACPCV